MAIHRKRSPLREKPLRIPGQSLEYQIEDKIASIGMYIFIAAIFILVALLEWIRLFTNPRPQPAFPTILAVLVLIYVSFKLVRLRKELVALRLGQDGERAVGEELQTLQKKDMAVLHDILGDKFNIDHIVVSNQGVFVLETKTYSKPIRENTTVRVENNQIFVNNKKYDRDPIQQVKNLSKWTRDLLEKSTGKNFPVRPVVLFPGWFVEKMKGGEEVWVLNPKALPTFIANEPNKISDSDVHLITFHLSRYIRTYCHS
jgi:hypothetical protein